MLDFICNGHVCLVHNFWPLPELLKSVKEKKKHHQHLEQFCALCVICQSVGVFCVCMLVLLTYPGAANQHHVSKELRPLRSVKHVIQKPKLMDFLSLKVVMLLSTETERRKAIGMLQNGSVRMNGAGLMCHSLS